MGRHRKQPSRHSTAAATATAPTKTQPKAIEEPAKDTKRDGYCSRCRRKRGEALTLQAAVCDPWCILDVRIEVLLLLLVAASQVAVFYTTDLRAAVPFMTRAVAVYLAVRLAVLVATILHNLLLWAGIRGGVALSAVCCLCAHAFSCMLTPAPHTHAAHIIRSVTGACCSWSWLCHVHSTTW